MRVLITAGGTREYIDPVRFISNASSGKMGFAIASAAIKAGHIVTLITTIDTPKLKTKNLKLKTIRVETAQEMFEAVKKHFEKCDCLVMAAAVADYTPAKRSKVKIKKEKSELIIKLKPTTDILKWAGKHKKNKKQIVIGFALEDRNLRQNAQKKLLEKNIDMIVANSTSAIGSADSSVQIKTRDGDWIEMPVMRKAAIAKRIITLAEGLYQSK